MPTSESLKERNRRLRRRRGWLTALAWIRDYERKQAHALSLEAGRPVVFKLPGVAPKEPE